MQVSPGVRLGPYEIVAPLGAGGWGEVWRARDTRLARDVAIKILPAELASNERFLARFDREARAISSLNHPNICTLYDVGVEGTTRYLVMEMIDGESLAQRLKKGPLPANQVLRLGGQIASALDRAHRQGIIHRDLKPANIMLTRSGAKLVDFGLAYLSSGSPLLTSDSREITKEQPLTAEGTIVGTFQYMAPEQLEGTEPDARTDIFALGAVLFEMATGQRAFVGASKASLIAAIMATPARPISALVPVAPPALDHVVRRCLEKHPDDRWQSAHDVASQLEWISESGSKESVAAASTRRRGERFRFASAIAAMVAITLFALAMAMSRPAPKPEVTCSRLLPPAGTEFDFNEGHVGSLAISPDGRRIALTSREESGRRALWIQSLDEPQPRRLSGTEGARFPFWSPDGRFIAFFADAKLKKIDVSGSAPFVLCDAPNGRSGAWNRDGVILFSAEGNKPISRVNDSGGPAVEITNIDVAKGETTHRWATFLPDGEHFLYLAGTHTLGSYSDFNAIYAASLDQPENRKLIVRARSNASYASGHILYVRDNVLVAQPFDPKRLETTGKAVPLTESVRYSFVFFRGVYSASDNGVVVYQPGIANSNAQLTWFDRSGKELGTLGHEGRVRGRPAISPDGTMAAASIEDDASGMRDIWLFDIARGTQTRFTFGPKSENTPVFSPNGSEIAYHEQNPTNPNDSFVMVRRTSGTEEARALVSVQGSVLPTAWSTDGATIIASKQRPSGDWDLVKLDAKKTNASLEPILARDGESDSIAVRTADGRWIAWFSDESGRSEMWATSYPGPGGKWQLTNTGIVMMGSSWGNNELLYSQDDGGIYSIPTAVNGETLSPGSPQLLFRNHRILSWVLAPDRERILAAVAADTKTNEPLAIIQNWPLKVPVE
ncbi:MAG: serine/threonine-protein kinase [Acidobacteria bacterium]|nr:serine/threonine-protein kinase [Acidobacteriota bacterium]